MKVFIKFIRLFHRQLLHRKIYFWTLFIVIIVMSFADNNQTLIYSLHDILYRYTLQQSVLVFIPILLVPICLNESFEDLNDRLFCIYSHSNALPKTALWLLLTTVSGALLSLGVYTNKLFQIQFYEIPNNICASYIIVGWLELASAFGIFIGLFKIFKRVFVIDVVYFFLVFFLLIVPLCLPLHYAHLMGFPLSRRSLDMLQHNPMLVIGSRLVYFMIAAILIFRKERTKKETL